MPIAKPYSEEEIKLIKKIAALPIKERKDAIREKFLPNYPERTYAGVYFRVTTTAYEAQTGQPYSSKPPSGKTRKPKVAAFKKPKKSPAQKAAETRKEKTNRLKRESYAKKKKSSGSGSPQLRKKYAFKKTSRSRFHPIKHGELAVNQSEIRFPFQSITIQGNEFVVKLLRQ